MQAGLKDWELVCVAEQKKVPSDPFTIFTPKCWIYSSIIVTYYMDLNLKHRDQIND